MDNEPSTSANAESSDINMEDTMKSVKATNKPNGNNESDEDGHASSNQDEDRTIITTTTSAVTKATFTKIAPKSITTTASGKNAQSGQVVIIHGPSGTPQPIRISGVSSNTAHNKTPVTIQVLKMPDGNVVHFKNNKNLNLTNLTQMNIGSKKVVLAPQSKLATSSGRTGTVGSPVLKTITTAEAQKAGLIKLKSTEAGSNKIHKILPTIANSSSATSTTTSNVSVKPNRFILADGKGVVVKSENETGSKQVIVPQVMKLSPNNAGPIQAIQIPGKSGIQYVRVLGTTASASGKPTVTAVRTSDGSSTKVSVVSSSSSSSAGTSGQRILLTNADKKQSIPVLNATKNGSGIVTTISKQNVKELATIPKLRKIGAAPAGKVIVVKKEPETKVQISQPLKPKNPGMSTQINVKRLSSSPNEKQTNQEKEGKPRSQYLILPQDFFNKMKSNSSQDDHDPEEDNSDNGFQRKLYSVLKPSPDQDDPLNNNRRKSPPVEDLRRKHCNCTKSQCLKLYCDCFANGEFCQDCNCKECFNNLENEDERQKAIRICLERNPNAFKPKITKARDQSDLRLHNKGCNCKRSGCLKNYCECYEAKITCSSNCKCFGCRNVEDRADMDPFESDVLHSFSRGVAVKRSYEEEKVPTPIPTKQPYNFITTDVVDATVQCMLAQAEECKRNGTPQVSSERMILEELGRCLVEIIDFSIRNMDN